MSRTKKSRKSGAGSNGAIKVDKEKLVSTKDKKPKKKTGKQSGNRQKEAFLQSSSAQDAQANKDPRLGNKNPIALGTATNKAAHKPINKKKKADKSPIAAIRTIEVDDSLEQEIHAIEQDERLQLILGKQEDEISLTEDEVEHFNKLMDRHQEIRTKLGWDDEDIDEDDEDMIGKSSRSEDDLWEKFDNSDLSDYE